MMFCLVRIGGSCAPTRAACRQMSQDETVAPVASLFADSFLSGSPAHSVVNARFTVKISAQRQARLHFDVSRVTQPSPSTSWSWLSDANPSTLLSVRKYLFQLE